MSVHLWFLPLNETSEAAENPVTTLVFNLKYQKTDFFSLNYFLAPPATCYNWYLSCYDITWMFSRNWKKLEETAKKFR